MISNPHEQQLFIHGLFLGLSITKWTRGIHFAVLTEENPSLIKVQIGKLTIDDDDRRFTKEGRVSTRTDRCLHRILDGLDVKVHRYQSLNGILAGRTPSQSNAARHNCRNSTFYKLPSEVLLLISGFASPYTRLILERVCSKFRSCLAPLVVAHRIKNEWSMSHEMLRFIWVNRRGTALAVLSRYEVACNTADRGSNFFRFGCSGCRAPHSIDDFSSEQLALPPQVRICHGLQGSIRLCDHYSFSGACLWQGLLELGHAKVECQHPSHETSTDGHYIQPFWGDFWPKLGFHGGHTITIDRVVPLFTVKKASTISQDRFRSALDKADAYVLVHTCALVALISLMEPF